MIKFCSLSTCPALCIWWVKFEIHFIANNGTLQGGRVRFQSEHWHFDDKIFSRWATLSCHPLPIRSRSQPVPAEQITEVVALTSEIDFLIQLSQCPRWRLRADSANRAGLREQNRFEFWPEQQTVLVQPVGARGRPRGKGRQRHPAVKPWTLAQGHCLKSRWSCLHN